MAWTDEQKKRVAVYLLDGMSSGQIAYRLDVSRNAVVSIVNRTPELKKIGFARAVGGDRAISRLMDKPRPKRERKPKLVIVPKPEPEPMPEPAPVIEIDTRAVPMWELDRNQCKWAVNDAEPGETHLFCGHDTDPGKPYCSCHSKLAYGPGTLSERMAVPRNQAA